MIALLWRRAIIGALRRSWAQRSSVWLAFAVVLFLLRRFDGASRHRAASRA